MCVDKTKTWQDLFVRCPFQAQSKSTALQHITWHNWKLKTLKPPSALPVQRNKKMEKPEWTNILCQSSISSPYSLLERNDLLMRAHGYISYALCWYKRKVISFYFLYFLCQRFFLLRFCILQFLQYIFTSYSLFTCPNWRKYITPLVWHKHIFCRIFILT